MYHVTEQNHLQIKGQYSLIKTFLSQSTNMCPGSADMHHRKTAETFPMVTGQEHVVVLHRFLRCFAEEVNAALGLVISPAALFLPSICSPCGLASHT